jgi:hypothetical protein
VFLRGLPDKKTSNNIMVVRASCSLLVEREQDVCPADTLRVVYPPEGYALQNWRNYILEVPRREELYDTRNI